MGSYAKMIENEELKPCPSCGGEAYYNICFGIPGELVSACPECRTCGLRALNVESWNNLDEEALNSLRGKKNNEELNFKSEEFHNAVRALDELIRYLHECENVYPEPHYGFEKCIELAKKARGYVAKLYG